MSIENITRVRSEAPSRHEIEGMPFQRTIVRWSERQKIDGDYVTKVMDRVIGAPKFVDRVIEAVKIIGRDPEDLWINPNSWGWWDGRDIVNPVVQPTDRGEYPPWMSNGWATRCVYLFLSHPLSNGAGIKFELCSNQRIRIKFLAPSLPGVTWGGAACPRYEPINTEVVRAGATAKTIATEVARKIEEWERRVQQLTEYREKNLKINLARLDELNRLREAINIPPLKIVDVLDSNGKWDLSSCINAYGRNSTQRGVLETADYGDGDVSTWDIVLTESPNTIKQPSHERRQYHANDGEIAMVVNSEDDEKFVEVRTFLPRDKAPDMVRRMIRSMGYVANFGGKPIAAWLRIGDGDYRLLEQPTTGETNERTNGTE